MSSTQNRKLSLPPLALRVGVTGLRPPKLTAQQEPQIRTAVREILSFVRQVTEELDRQIRSSHQDCDLKEPKLWIVSALAEGADRVAAQEALKLQFKLQCPLPAFPDEYRHDFKTQRSRDEFDGLLFEADAVFELDGQRQGEWLESAAYEAAGRLMLMHSDILLAVWDGNEGERGGTGQMVKEAGQAGICTVVLDPNNPMRAEFRLAGRDPAPDWRAELRQSLGQILLPPPNAIAGVKEFFEKPLVTYDPPPLAEQRDHADGAALLAARNYRRAYKTIYTLAPLAVLCAVSGLWQAINHREFRPEWLLTLLELIFIAMILWLTWWGGGHSHWHRRWLDARQLAEQFRCWVVLAPIGQVPAISRIPPYISQETGERDWTGWYLRARVREQSIISARVTPDYLEQYQNEFVDVVTQQAEHHARKGQSRERTHKLVEKISFALFALTVIACFLHLSGRFSVFWLTTLGALTAAMPAFGAAFEGLQAQGEYRRLAGRAKGMEAFLRGVLQNRLPSPGTKPLTYVELAQIAHETSWVMLDEVSDWRNLIRVLDLHIS